ncbi:Methyltransferase domain protein [Planctomycetes bacterium Pla163]|uniref:Methyltransferase domain protein n=1 Tax=Rohdeia mirabilis TaxID=2528008 RepID=A0A518CYU6_9BACT|nr:Methyltransferase domain protein [Planctomycetes bacterium Pla163]
MQNPPRICALIASRNRPDLVDDMVARLSRSTAYDIDFVVVECGTDPSKLSKHSSLWYSDEDFRGKCYGHNLALAEARQRATQSGREYDYYWVLMNDVVFEDGVDAAKILVDTLEREPRMAICSPTNVDGQYPGCAPRARGGFRTVTTCDYLGFMLRAEAADEVGFLNPAFRYCWGAIHELSYKLYSAGWSVAYSDDVAYRHLGGTTYGAPGTATIGREEYQHFARAFANDYFVRNYGADWHVRFFAAASRGHEIEIDTFALHRELWSNGAFRADASSAPESASECFLLPPDERTADGRERVRLHLGCGRDLRPGWINVDTSDAVGADLVADVTDLVGIADASVDVIEANHLFEHLTRDQALAALREWRRVLRGDGELYLELPDLEACIRILGKHTDDRGYDLGLTGMYGWGPDIAADGVPQMHKWGWTREALTEALVEAGFGAVDFGPITQSWRPAARYGRDMRVRARVAAAVPRSRVDAPPSLAPAPVQDFAGSGPLGTLGSSARSGRSSDSDAPDGANSNSSMLHTNPSNVSRPSASNSNASASSAAPMSDTVALFAWPDYSVAGELDYLFGEFALNLLGRGALMLRYQAALDGPRDQVIARLDAACARVLGDRAFDVILIDQEFDAVGWQRLGEMTTAVVVLPSAQNEVRRHALASVRSRLVSRFDQLVAPQESARAA